MTSALFFKRNEKVACVLLGAFWFVVIGIGLVACKPESVPPMTAEATLEHVQTSNSEVIFILTNGSNKTLSIRGRRTLLLGIQPWTSDRGIECEMSPSKGSEEDPIGLGDGNPVIFKVSPGERARLTIPTTLPQRYKGGQCHLRLMLQDGTIIGPITFKP